uniref:Serine carboxypeptidase S28 n=1 Tax=Tetradesmus obliquus TaxID=3088 RepID=A0A383VGH4_TETOB|eukprot:jgi/Sobl393_1/8876/SZX73350.1
MLPFETLISILVLTFFATRTLAEPINFQYNNYHGDEHPVTVTASGAVVAASQAPQHGQQPPQFFAITQKVKAPKLVNPARLPVCYNATEISQLIGTNINTKFGIINTTMETTYLQVVDECTYTSLISYNGSAEAKEALLAAADSSSLCSVLTTYCAKVFGPPSEYVLLSTGGDASPPTPIIQEFNCVQEYLQQRLDHFSSSDSRRFKQMYWVCDGAWPKSKSAQARHGNVVVFLGGEGPLSRPQRPIIFENAKRLHALVIQVEHRYYGESMPFELPGNATQLPTEQYKWLTIEQVIEDNSAVVAAVRQQMRVPEKVPAMAIGGSYAGMLATYHRVLKPHTYAAAIASSAPNNFVFGTDGWAAAANNYHIRIADSLTKNSGSSACASTVRQGLEELMRLSKSAAGRAKLGQVFRVCNASSVLANDKQGYNFFNDQYGQYHGYAQVNNEPSLLHQVELLCELVADSIQQGSTPLEAVAAVNTYFQIANATGCYKFDPTYILIGTSLASYSYQCCTQGFVYSSAMPAAGSPNTITPAYTVTPQQLRSECEQLFGNNLPPLKVPAVADPTVVKALVRKVGGVVFTNGNADGWSGGSYYSYLDLVGPNVAGVQGLDGRAERRPAAAAAAGEGSIDIWEEVQRQSAAPGTVVGSTEVEGSTPAAAAAVEPGGKRPQPSAAFVVYDGGSHCTDLASRNFDNPAQPAVYVAQRAQAMDAAVRFMQQRTVK